MLSWRIGTVKITQIVELTTASLGPYLLPQAEPAKMLEVPWLAPFIDADDASIQLALKLDQLDCLLVKRAVSNSKADPLRRAVAGVGGGSAGGAGYDVATIQRALTARGYNAGPADGVMGGKTRDAIRKYQVDKGLSVTGLPSMELQKSLIDG